jgi:hypothetical protein
VTAIEELVALREDLERAGTTVMELARHGRPEEPWTIYPDEYGVFDRKTRSQFYYHTHGSPDEAGHFHTVRLFDDHTLHLVAISMDRTGRPQALFTVNLWAIGDVYEPPDRLKRYARRFQLGVTPWDPRLVRFVNLVFEAFLPEIERLQDAKEEAFAAYRATHPDANPFEDRSLEILSRVALDLGSLTKPATTGRHSRHPPRLT